MAACWIQLSGDHAPSCSRWPVAPVELAEAEVAVGDELGDLHANSFVAPRGHLGFNFTSS